MECFSEKQDYVGKVRPQGGLLIRARALAQQLTNDFRQAQHMPFPASGSLAFIFQSPALNAASGPEVLRTFVFFFGPFTLNTTRGPTENHVTENHVTQAYFVFKNMSR